ncbi:anti-sigma factor family protein [Planctomycetota bacterium]
MNSRFEELLSRYLDGDSDPEITAEVRKLVERDPELRERFRGTVRLHTLIHEVSAETGASERRPSVIRTGRWMPALAAAAIILAAAGAAALFISRRQTSDQHRLLAGTSAFEQLVRQAPGARNVSDLRALLPLARRAHQDELDRGDDAALIKLVLLGLSERICERPVQDRQTDDLRFIVTQAAESVAPPALTFPCTGLMSVAEAAAPRMSVEQRRQYRNLYLESRALLQKGDYYLYSAVAHSIVKLFANYTEEIPFRFTYAYVLITERDMGPVVLKYADSWLIAGPYAAHYRTHLRPALLDRVTRGRELEANLGLVAGGPIPGIGGGQWFILNQDNRFVVENPAANRENAILPLDGTPFREAEFTGMVRMEPHPRFPARPESKVGVLYHFGGNDAKQVWIPPEWTLRAAWVLESNDFHRWTHFRLHVTRLDGGRWKHALYLRFEGALDEEKIEERISDGPAGTGDARVGVATAYARGKWVELGLRIIRPGKGD